jgi:outer membrane protein OmpA-like peptidoglycan-associated protein
VIILAKRLNQPGPQRLKVSYDAVPKGWIQSGWRDGLTLQQLWLGLGSSFDAMGNVKYWRRLVETPEYADSSWYKDFIRRMAPRRDAYTAVRKMAAPFIREGAYAEAAQVFARYRERFPRLQAAIDSTIALLRRKPSDLQPQNLGMGVNSPVNEYEPVPSADGQRLYFTGQGRMEKLGGEDIYVAEWQGDRWGDAELLPRPLNTKEYNESANAVSADGTKLYAFANHKSGPGSGDNFVARRQAEGWGPLQPLKRPINSPHFDSEAMESGDGQALFFVSDRPGGQGRFAEKGNLYLGSTLGNTDIYVSRRTDTGWAAPINLGAVINTPFAERSPYLHPDGRTLYFSSAGHNSIGGLDVFVSRRKHADSWTEWTEPVNLGKAINTPDDDWGYRVATDGDRAYFAKMNREDTGSAGHNDLYSIRLPERVQPDPVVKVRGKILAPDSTPIGADLRWTTPARQQPVASQASDPADGSYFTILTPGRQYTLRAEAPAYHGATGSLDLREVTGRLDTNLTLVLAPRPSAERTDEATGGDPPASDNASGAPAGPADTASRARRQARVYFATDRAALQPEAPEQLRPLLTYLRAHPSARLRITGHTDSRATEPYNRRLAERRAEAAARWFRQQGIAPARMTTRSAGENQPIAPNTTPSGRAKNRRAVVKIVPGE